MDLWQTLKVQILETTSVLKCNWGLHLEVRLKARLCKLALALAIALVKVTDA